MTTKAAPAPQQRTVTAEELVEGGDLTVILNEIINRLCPTADKSTRETIRSGLNYAIEKAIASGSDLQELDLWLGEICSSLQERLDAQVGEILHNKTFQEHEGRWKGLEQLAGDLTKNQQLTVFSASLPELRADAKKAATLMDRSQLFQKLYKNGIGQDGLTPFAAVFVGQYFTSEAQDVELLKKLSDYGAAIHAPVFTNAHAKIFNEDSFRELPALIADELEKRVAAAPAWRQLRAHPNSRYLGVTLPRVLTRLPYHPDKNSPGEAYPDYREKITGPGDYVYTAASYSLARQVLGSFRRDGRPNNITGQTSGGKVDGLVAEPKKFATEALIDFKHEKTLSVDLGFIPLMAVANTAEAYFAAVPSVQKLKDFGSSAEAQEKSSNWARGTQLDNLLLISNFAHRITAMQRKLVGERLDSKAIKDYLVTFLQESKYPDGRRVTPELARRFPLKNFSVTVRPDPGRPGWYQIDVQFTTIDTYQGAEIALSFAGEENKEGG